MGFAQWWAENGQFVIGVGILLVAAVIAYVFGKANAATEDNCKSDSTDL